LSEEELEIAISLNGTSFVAVFSFQVCHEEWISEFCISALAVVKYVFTLKHIYTFCYINSIFGQF
jgi:hypothetical protein